ncbi:hypothetical protein IW261DRAFT_1522606 [Armillaria novae-zelandiae]|uniref:Uncharacterized protein n=1 Tax=Armillaria novae-zelandiae TaxID=153914 RepID=A0AA39NHH8_9AGAR|nr:hypothetical protein IW261DRAFT_1522606 [Armillaria novae-zelandiae]
MRENANANADVKTQTNALTQNSMCPRNEEEKEEKVKEKVSSSPDDSHRLSSTAVWYDSKKKIGSDATFYIIASFEGEHNDGSGGSGRGGIDMVLEVSRRSFIQASRVMEQAEHQEGPDPDITLGAPTCSFADPAVVTELRDDSDAKPAHSLFTKCC